MGFPMNEGVAIRFMNGNAPIDTYYLLPTIRISIDKMGLDHHWWIDIAWLSFKATFKWRDYSTLIEKTSEEADKVNSCTRYYPKRSKDGR